MATVGAIARGRQDLFEFWVSKGRIRKHFEQGGCNEFCACSFQQQREIYLWNPQLGNISIDIE